MARLHDQATPIPETPPLHGTLTAIVVWIERKYHRQRAQDALGGLTPIEFEAKLTEPLTLAA